MDWLTMLLLISGGLVCGVINVIGGGGSLLALPILLALGLPAGVANGTNRIAIVLQDVSALLTFRKQHVNPWRETSMLVIPVLLGALGGAWMAALWLTESMMNYVILSLVVLMLILVSSKRDSWLKQTNRELPGRLPLSGYVLFFALGFYGGFIQAGFTYLIMAALVMRLGSTMVTSDAVKLLLNLIITPFALVVFVWHDQVNWGYGLVMGIGSLIGGYLGTRLAAWLSPAAARRMLLVLLMLSGLYVLFFRVL